MVVNENSNAIGEVQGMLEAMPFAKLLGIRIVAVSKDELVSSLTWREELTTTGLVVHGGVLMGFADAVGALLAFLNLPPGTGTTTVESKTNFFKAATEGVTLTAISKPLSVGRSFIVVQTDVFNEKKQRIAQVTQTQAVLGARL